MFFSNIYFYIIIVIFAPIIGRLIKASFDLYKKIKEYNRGNDIISALNRLTQREFEIWSCEYLGLQNYTNISLVPPKLDNAKNIICNKNNSVYYVECKKYSKEQFVSLSDIESLLGSMIINNISNGIIITTNTINDEGRKALSSLPSNYSITIYDSSRITGSSAALSYIH